MAISFKSITTLVLGRVKRFAPLLKGRDNGLGMEDVHSLDGTVLLILRRAANHQLSLGCAHPCDVRAF